MVSIVDHTDKNVLLSYRSMGLVVSRETQHMGVQYYVDKSFEKEYHGVALDELEKTIESDYIDHLQSSCWKEKQQSEYAHQYVCIIKFSLALCNVVDVSFTLTTCII